jgi:hypothetical protein
MPFAEGLFRQALPPAAAALAALVAFIPRFIRGFGHRGDFLALFVPVVMLGLRRVMRCVIAVLRGLFLGSALGRGMLRLSAAAMAVPSAMPVASTVPVASAVASAAFAALAFLVPGLFAPAFRRLVCRL